MKPLFVILITSLFYFVAANTLTAQPQQGRGNNTAERPAIGILKGKLVDDATGNPIEYGTLAIISMRDSSIAGGGISDPRGYFNITQIKAGRYFVKIQFIGFETKIVNNVIFRPDAPEVDLGTIRLSNKATSLSGVEIKAEKEMMAYNLDKKVINVDKNIASIGGSAVEVMQSIPSVTVDVDGNVKLRGSANVTILIDGKPSGMTDISTSDLLQQIPASSIETIEIITNPSVRYDPEGTSGIINIVLKKKSLQGLNGMISATAGTGERYSGSLNLNLRQKKFNFFAGYDTRIGKFRSTGDSKRTTTYDGISSDLLQTTRMENERNGSSLNTGFDLLLDPLNTLTFSFQYRNMSFGNDGIVWSETYNPEAELIRSINRYSNSSREMESYTYNGSYKRTFATKGKELTVDFMLSDNKMNGLQQIEQTELFITGETPVPVLQSSGSGNSSRVYMLQSNFVTPIGKTGRIETGFKSTLKDLSMKNNLKDFNYNLNEWIQNPLANNYFDYTEQVHAIYGIYSSYYKKLKYQAGVRLEQLISTSKLALTNEKFDRTYPSIYPSIHLVYEKNATQQYSLSYSRRVSRPSYRQLNPFVDYADSLNIRYGNPKLDPEYINSYELGWSNYWGKNSLNATTFLRQNFGIIDHIVTLQDNSVTATTFENLTSGTSFGVEMIGNREFAKWMKTNANFSFFRQVIKGSEIGGIEKTAGNMWTAKVNLTFILAKNASLMLAGNYESPEVEAQSRDEAVYFADAAFRYDFLKGKASVNLRVSDIFNSRSFNSTTTGEGFTITNKRKMETRVGYLGFTYRINNYNKQRERDRSNQQESGSDMEDF